MGLPFAIVDDRPMLIGLEHLSGGDEVLIGFDPVDLNLWHFEPDDIQSIVSIDPVAVYGGVQMAWAVEAEYIAAANKPRKRLPRFAAKGHGFPLLPDGAVSGFPVASKALRKHRAEVPSVDAIRLSSLFAVSTVRTSIAEAERSFNCFGDLYLGRGRSMPPVQEIAGCFRGLQNSKSKMFNDVAGYAETIRQAIKTGYMDRELRSVLALDSDLPNGLGLAKLSFTLALLGHDCICLDGRLLGTMFTKSDRLDFENAIGKERGRVSERALMTYEAAEDAFLAGNKYYDPRDPIGRARCQWLSWEAVGGKGATHSVWLKMLPAE